MRCTRVYRKIKPFVSHSLIKELLINIDKALKCFSTFLMEQLKFPLIQNVSKGFFYFFIHSADYCSLLCIARMFAPIFIFCTLFFPQ